MAKSNKVIIYGNGTIARMVSRYLSKNHEIVGFTVDREHITENHISGLPVKGFDDIEMFFPPSEHLMLVAVGFVQMNQIRTDRAADARKKGYRLINYVHPSVDCSSVEIEGDNNIILEHSSLHPGTVIGSSNFISSNTNIGHGCQIGNGCWFNAGVSIGGETTIRDHSVFSINAGANNNIVVERETFVGPGVFLDSSTHPGDVFLTEACVKYRLKSRSFLKLMNVG